MQPSQMRKPWYRSKVTRLALATILGAIAAYLGNKISTMEAIATNVSALAVVFGRATAETSIEATRENTAAIGRLINVSLDPPKPRDH